jgi:hypothetical protein
MRGYPRRGVIAILMVVWAPLGSCAVTRTNSLQSQPGQDWIRQNAGSIVVVESPGGAKISGRLVGATAEVVHLQGADLTPVAIAAATGANLSHQRRGAGAVTGAFVGAGVGVVLGAVLTASLGSPNPDSAGGVEHPPAAVMIPLGALVGSVVGVITGFAVGAERRLELRADSPP